MLLLGLAVTRTKVSGPTEVLVQGLAVGTRTKVWPTEVLLLGGVAELG